MYIKPLWWLITVLNMNKIHWFISNISPQTYTYEIMDINATFRQGAKVYFVSGSYCGWLLYKIWTKSIIFFLKYHNKHIQFMKYIARITQIWYGAKCYFTQSSNTGCLITVQHMNNINPFFSEISQQTQNVWKSGHKYSNLAQSKILFYKHKQHMVYDYCTKYEQNHHILLWDIKTNT